MPFALLMIFYCFHKTEHTEMKKEIFHQGEMVALKMKKITGKYYHPGPPISWSSPLIPPTFPQV
jgi:hypothetical protein